MKAIIFDVDDTLIKWKKENIWALEKVIKDMNYDFNEDLIKKIDSMIDDNEKKNSELSKEVLLNHINKNCNINLPLEFIDRLIQEQGNLFYEDKELVETIDYLSKKYDLYVITNWFTETQTKRLENMGIIKYFKKIIGADINYLKPDKRCFDIIFKDYKPEDCTYVGDYFPFDIELPLSLGMDAIWKTKEENKEYKTIKTIYELKDIL